MPFIITPNISIQMLFILLHVLDLDSYTIIFLYENTFFCRILQSEVRSFDLQSFISLPRSQVKSRL